MITVESLGVDFFFNGIRDVERAEHAKEVVNGLLSGLGKLVGAAGGVYKLGDAIRDFINDAVELQNVAKASNNGIESLSAWSQAYQSTGGNVQTFLGTIEGLGKAIKQAHIEGGPMRQYLHQLGVDTRNTNGTMKETTQVLMDIANSPYWKRLSESEQLFVGERLGLDQDTIRMLQRGGDALQDMIDLQHELGVVTEDQVKMSRETYNAYYELVNIWRTVSNMIVAALLPAVKWLLTGLRDLSLWIVKNKPVLYGLISGITMLLSKILIPVLTRLAWAWVKAFWPVALIIGILGALSAAIYVLYNDYQVWKNGGKAAFGEIWTTWEPIATALISSMEAVGTFFKNVWKDPKKVWNDTVNYFKNRWKGMSLTEIAKDIITSFSTSISNTWNNLVVPFLLSLDNQFKKWFGFSLYEEGKSTLNTFWNGINETWAWIKDKFTNLDWFAMGEDAGKTVGKALSDAWALYLDFLTAASEVDWMGVAKTLLDGLIKVAEFLGQVAHKLTDMVLGFIYGALSEIGPRVKNALVDAGKAGLEAVKNLPGNVWDSVKEFAGFGPSDQLPEGTSAYDPGNARNFGGAGGMILAPGMGMPGRAYAYPDSPPPPGTGSARTSETNNSVTVGTVAIEVNNPKDSKAVVDASRAEIDKIFGSVFQADGAVGT